MHESVWTIAWTCSFYRQSPQIRDGEFFRVDEKGVHLKIPRNDFGVFSILQYTREEEAFYRSWKLMFAKGAPKKKPKRTQGLGRIHTGLALHLILRQVFQRRKLKWVCHCSQVLSYLISQEARARATPEGIGTSVGFIVSKK
ncbi:hypothetical protein MUP05_05085 [Candidatus Bathyarchaeota archaeon]|nr:hypothetical protein [Candidatus Bathyarchaeota archaeon]